MKTNQKLSLVVLQEHLPSTQGAFKQPVRGVTINNSFQLEQLTSILCRKNFLDVFFISKSESSVLFTQTIPKELITRPISFSNMITLDLIGASALIYAPAMARLAANACTVGQFLTKKVKCQQHFCAWQAVIQ